MDEEEVILHLYFLYAKNLGWSLRDIEETNFETLIDFLYFKEDSDPNTRIIGDKVYKRTSSTPNWL